MKPIPGPDSCTYKIHIGNLPDRCSEEIIRKQFTAFGEIVDLHVKKSYAFVHFKNESDAYRAVHDMNGTQLFDKTINVSIARREVKDKSGRWRIDMRRAPKNSRDAKKDDFAQSLSNLSEMLGGPGPFKPAVSPGLKDNSYTFAGSGAGAGHGELQMGTGEVTYQSTYAKNESPPPLQPNIQDIKYNNDNPMGNHFASENKPVQSKPPPSLNSIVLYERYYVDPNHKLLKGLPLPQVLSANLNHAGTPPSAANYISRDASRSELYAVPIDTSSSSSKLRSRSPLPPRQDIDRWNHQS